VKKEEYEQRAWLLEGHQTTLSHKSFRENKNVLKELVRTRLQQDCGKFGFLSNVVGSSWRYLSIKVI
jgi:hypothetical protein